VGLTSRRRGEDVVKLMRACDINPTPFIDPLLGKAEEEEEEYRTPQSELDRIMGGGGSGRRLSALNETGGRFQAHGGGYQGEYYGGVGAQVRGGAPTPRLAPRGLEFGMGFERGPFRGFAGRATPQMQFAPQVQHVERVVRTPAIPEQP
jgi:hypothetical protein